MWKNKFEVKMMEILFFLPGCLWCLKIPPDEIPLLQSGAVAGKLKLSGTYSRCSPAVSSYSV